MLKSLKLLHDKSEINDTAVYSAALELCVSGSCIFSFIFFGGLKV